MATGRNDQLKPGHEGYSWGIDSETMGPPGRNRPWDWVAPEQREQRRMMGLLLVMA